MDYVVQQIQNRSKQVEFWPSSILCTIALSEFRSGVHRLFCTQLSSLSSAAWFCSSSTSNWWPRCSQFDSMPVHCHLNDLWQVVHTHVPLTKQYNLLPVQLPGKGTTVWGKRLALHPYIWAVFALNCWLKAIGNGNVHSSHWSQAERVLLTIGNLTYNFCLSFFQYCFVQFACCWVVFARNWRMIVGLHQLLQMVRYDIYVCNGVSILPLIISLLSANVVDYASNHFVHVRVITSEQGCIKLQLFLLFGQIRIFSFFHCSEIQMLVLVLKISC